MSPGIRSVVSGLGIVLSGIAGHSAHAFDVLAGQTVYETHCANCHGFDGVPMTPDTPDFSLGQGLDKPDRLLFEAISTGMTLMPGYDGIINNEDILNVIAYVRTLPR